MEMSSKVLVVGAGISGLTLAVALRLKGYDVDVAEIKTNLTMQVGVGLSLQGNALAAFGKVGLAQEMIEKSIPGCYLNMRKPNGDLLVRQPVIQMGGPGYPATAGISRVALHETLITRARELGANLMMGVTLVSYRDEQNFVSAELSDGSLNQYALIVGADGIYSKIRKFLFPDVKPRKLGQLSWRVEVPRKLGTFTSDLHFGGAFGVVGTCPISEDRAYLYVIESKELEGPIPEDELLPTLKDMLRSYTSPIIQDAVASIEDGRAINARPLEALLIPERWYVGRVMVIGDAAHAGPPVLAQGAAMGVEDAVVLAETLASAKNVNEALERFMERRLARASMVVNNSVQLCEWEVNHQASPQQIGKLMQETQLSLSQPF